MFDNFTDSSKELIYNAQNTALENHNTLIEPVHIINSMIESSTDIVNMLFEELKINNSNQTRKYLWIHENKFSI